jgi:hypothetical protein
MEWAANRGEDQKRLALAVISVQRKALLDARDDRYFGAEALNAPRPYWTLTGSASN